MNSINLVRDYYSTMVEPTSNESFISDSTKKENRRFQTLDAIQGPEVAKRIKSLEKQIKEYYQSEFFNIETMESLRHKLTTYQLQEMQSCFQYTKNELIETQKKLGDKEAVLIALIKKTNKKVGDLQEKNEKMEEEIKENQKKFTKYKEKLSSQDKDMEYKEDGRRRAVNKLRKTQVQVTKLEQRYKELDQGYKLLQDQLNNKISELLTIQLSNKDIIGQNENTIAHLKGLLANQEAQIHKPSKELTNATKKLEIQPTNASQLQQHKNIIEFLKEQLDAQDKELATQYWQILELMDEREDGIEKLKIELTNEYESTIIHLNELLENQESHIHELSEKLTNATKQMAIQSTKTSQLESKIECLTKQLANKDMQIRELELKLNNKRTQIPSLNQLYPDNHFDKLMKNN